MLGGTSQDSTICTVLVGCSYVLVLLCRFVFEGHPAQLALVDNAASKERKLKRENANKQHESKKTN
jgi:hypothetical protein